MRILGRAALQDVRDALWQSRGRTEGSGPWTGPLLDLADAQLGPDWWDVELTGPDALAIVLPRHAGEFCHGDRMTLVGLRGLSVADAAQRFRAIEADYARLNRSCWGRIDHARRQPLSRVILSTAPIDHEEYRGLRAPRAAGSPAGVPRLICLDGRHRLIGWAVAGALGTEVVVPAHVAGRLAPDEA